MNEFPCPECGELRPPFSKSCACGWRAAAKPKPAASTNCACGRFGIAKINGAWVCGICAGGNRRPSGTHVPYRDRWYQEHGLEYEPPKLGDLPPFRCVGRTAAAVVTREPGWDDDEIQAVS